MVYTLARQRDRYKRIIVLYGGRSPLDLLYRVELEKWANENDIETLVTVDRGDTSWKGHIGVVTGHFNYIKLDARETVAYVCGPEIMMKYTVDELERRGVPPGQVFLSMERNMQCAVGFCGHCQFGPTFICKEVPVYPLPKIRPLMDRKELCDAGEEAQDSRLQVRLLRRVPAFAPGRRRRTARGGRGRGHRELPRGQPPGDARPV